MQGLLKAWVGILTASYLLSKMSLVSWKIQILLFYFSLYFNDCGALLTPTEAPKSYLERLHVPQERWISYYNNGSEMPNYKWQSPDFRLEEDAWLPYVSDFWKESKRPYRFSPYYKQLYRWNRGRYRGWPKYEASADYLGCYCTTVYKRMTVLAGCAVLTFRHILTTATSTELVLQNHRHEKTLNNILGAWYDTDADTFNSSMYMTPSRITYHPLYLPPHKVNLTHPLPCRFDLSVWTATISLYYSFVFNPFGKNAVICRRGGPHSWQHLSSTPNYWHTGMVVGFQYVKAQRKIPAPWYRYVTRVSDWVVPCPKTQWNWFHCLRGTGVWSKYGVESGAALHRALANNYWLYDGMIGMCAFSMKLRSTELVHYFTVLNTHPVLNFMYDSYMGWRAYEYLDHRFENSRPYPRIKRGHYVWFGYPLGVEHYSDYKIHNLPWY